MMRRALQAFLLVVLLVGLPLVGIALVGKPIAPYLEFPPATRYVEPAPFSWVAFMVLSLFVAGSVFPFLMKILSAPRPVRFYLERTMPFPWWGWGGVLGLTIAWMLAWTRFPWFESLQPFTFTPQWLGFIVVINALTFRRTGRCLMLNRPRFFCALFPLSAVFWWFFEYLNRFVQNWHYVGVGVLTPIEYFWHATLPFSTVLPAVLGTIQWLESFPRLDSTFRGLWPLDVPNETVLGWVLLIIASAGLMGIGLWPQYLFPLLWVSPLLVITSLQMLLREDTILTNLRYGDWRGIWLPASAGLICGFFWEMWNSHSLARWEYAIPYVHHYQLFEMPLLGYAGYLPFGIECVVVAGLLSGRNPPAGTTSSRPL